jgi:hypothetical protein
LSDRPIAETRELDEEPETRRQLDENYHGKNTRTELAKFQKEESTLAGKNLTSSSLGNANRTR